MALSKLGNQQGYVKCGMLGYAKSGKTFTATKLAIGVKKFFNHPGPIAFFDTESGSNYVAEMVKAESGQDLLGVRARSFRELMQFANDCVEAKVSVAIVDSITHPWKEICDSYLIQLNEKRRARNFAPLQKLEFQNWAAIKSMWEEWPNFFLNSPLHIIVCGRAGAIWDMEKNEETGRKELIKSGVKMKVETEFSFESSLLVEMEREQIPDGDGGFRIVHQATVLGDRFGVLDGKTCTNPTFDFFVEHIKKLQPGAHGPVDVASKTQTGADIEGSGDWQRERTTRTILCEEIQGAIVSKYPGQSAEEKKTKADLLAKYFGTRSWTAVENLQSEQLREGLYRLKRDLGIDQPPVSILETDIGDLGPQSPQAAPGGVSTPPAPEKASLPPSGEAGGTAKGRIPPLKQVQLLIAGWKPPVTEAQVLAHLANTGSIEHGIDSLEELSLLKPEVVAMVAEEWVTIQQAMLAKK